MTITEKRELIVSNPKNAYYELINRSNFSFYSDAFFIAEQAIIEIAEGGKIGFQNGNGPVGAT